MNPCTSIAHSVVQAMLVVVYTPHWTLEYNSVKYRLHFEVI